MNIGKMEETVELCDIGGEKSSGRNQRRRLVK